MKKFTSILTAVTVFAALIAFTAPAAAQSYYQPTKIVDSTLGSATATATQFPNRVLAGTTTNSFVKIDCRGGKDLFFYFTGVGHDTTVTNTVITLKASPDGTTNNLASFATVTVPLNSTTAVGWATNFGSYAPSPLGATPYLYVTAIQANWTGSAALTNYSITVHVK